MIERWVESRLECKTTTPPPVRLEDLASRAVVYACSATGLVEFDSKGARAKDSAAFAVRCSAAIPFFFESPSISGTKVFDGGVRQNFPLERFIRDNSHLPVIGLYLRPPPRRNRFVLTQLMDAVTTGEEPEAVRRYSAQVVSIETSPIRTTDFSLDADGKELLLASGRAAALRYLRLYLPDSSPPETYVAEAEQEVYNMRRIVARSMRRSL